MNVKFRVPEVDRLLVVLEDVLEIPDLATCESSLRLMTALWYVLLFFFV